MRKLISLEIKKYKLFSYLKGVAIANLAIMAMLCLVYYGEKVEGVVAYENYEMAFGVIGSIIRPVFIIFAAVLISKLIIDEYRSNSISLMFTYPINRKKIIIAKLAIVASFTFLTIVLSNLLIGSVFYLVDSYLHFVPEALTGKVLTDSLITMTLEAIASAGMALIPLYFGMRKKSTVAPIVSAIVMVSLINSTVNGVNLVTFIVIPIALAIIGCAIAYFSFRNIENVDVI
ncbi:ABC transporter permease [Neobacillus niacini]|uniref:ABC transporter permease n=1 Tax=Neobacillus niacini TaxID=86668 RepID=UPI0021CB6418|nr:ABC transporter permease [Neobacillus niacini]MCM3765069.1 ABC transporter permease [Neobacillus niacini]